MKRILYKISKYLITYIALLTIIFYISKIVLNLFNLDFLNWIYYISSFIITFGIILGVVQIIFKIKKLKYRVVLSIMSIIIFIILSPIILLNICLLHDKNEYTVKIGNEKMIVEVVSFNNTNINYYKYINPFLKNKIILKSEYSLKGNYNPFKDDYNYKKMIVKDWNYFVQSKLK